MRVFDHQHRRHLALGRLALPSRFSGEGAVDLGACVAILDVLPSPSALTSPSARLAGAPRVDARAVDGRQSLTHGFSQACRRCAGPPRTLPAACTILMASRASLISPEAPRARALSSSFWLTLGSAGWEVLTSKNMSPPPSSPSSLSLIHI